MGLRSRRSGDEEWGTPAVPRNRIGEAADHPDDDDTIAYPDPDILDDDQWSSRADHGPRNRFPVVLVVVGLVVVVMVVITGISHMSPMIGV
ncbi:MAG TPA: hypothetical protein VHX38_02810 [Pseudonocardiaceae bacterium]|jgi:hypothetical protein|nr:hypothetical protein [Pseudonocardiaceae bacterium]